MDDMGHRQVSERHVALLGDLAADIDRNWAVQALEACLLHLASGTPTEAQAVEVTDASVDGSDAFWITYRPANSGSLGVIGLRREQADAARISSDSWRPDDMTDGYDMGGELTDPDPVMFGWNVADFDLGEPPGHLRGHGGRHGQLDDNGVLWWGALKDGLPPSATP